MYSQEQLKQMHVSNMDYITILEDGKILLISPAWESGEGTDRWYTIWQRVMTLDEYKEYLEERV